MVKNKKSQALSTDIVVVMVILLFGVLFLVMNRIGQLEEGPSIEERYETSALQSKVIVGYLKDTDIIDSENNVDAQRLLNIEKDKLKEDLNIGDDFVIVFEKDGKLVKIDSENNINCFGSDTFIVNGQTCD